MEIQDLVGFGMTKTEAKIYLEISKLGETQIGPIIKRTELHRGTVYNSINNLIEKGFLSFIDKDRLRFYKVSGKKIFEEIVKEKQKVLEEENKELGKFFEDLQKLKGNEGEEEAHVFYGVKAFKTLFLEMYDYCKKNNWEYFFQGKGGEMQNATGEAFYRYTQKLKKKMKIRCRVILDKESRFLPYHKYTVGNIRYLPTKISSPINFWIYGGTILLVLFRTKPLTNIKIKNKSLSDGFKNYFETIWGYIEKEQKIVDKRHLINFYELINESENSLDLLDICEMEPLHEGRSKILELLKRGKMVRVLLANTQSKNFKKRVKLEEQFIKNLNQSRIFYELKSAIVNLRDIQNRLLKKGLKKINLEVRLYSKPSEYTIIIIDNKKGLYNHYGKKRGQYGASGETLILNKEDKEFQKAKDIFEEYWKSAKPLKI